MKPLPIDPIPLPFALRYDSLLYDDIGAFNRLLAMANSGIAAYFYGMPDSFEALALGLGLSPSELARKSFGEVALLVDRLCDDVDSDSHVTAGHDVLDAFIEPLAHLSLFLKDEEEPIPQPQWKKIRLGNRLASDCALAPVELDVSLGNYFEDNFSARKCQRPELRLFHSFSFYIQDYCTAVMWILGEGGLLEKAIAPFREEHSNLLMLIRKLVRTCRRYCDNITVTFDDDIDLVVTQSDTQISAAYDALRLLLIRPFALIHSDTESDKAEATPDDMER